MSSFFYKEYTVELLHKPSLKNTYIGVESNNTILVKSSNDSQRYILDILKLRDTWIEKQFSKQKTYISLEMNMEDEILLFSQKYSIDTQEASDLREKLHKLRVTSPKKIMQCYDNFYKKTAAEYLKQRVEYFSIMMNLSFDMIKYRKMKGRWGSCSSTKVITFNTELMKVDKKLIDYVIVHELAHLRYMNHSKDFHSLAEVYLPESKQLRKRLHQIRLG